MVGALVHFFTRLNWESDELLKSWVTLIIVGKARAVRSRYTMPVIEITTSSSYSSVLYEYISLFPCFFFLSLVCLVFSYLFIWVEFLSLGNVRVAYCLNGFTKLLLHEPYSRSLFSFNVPRRYNYNLVWIEYFPWRRSACLLYRNYLHLL